MSLDEKTFALGKLQLKLREFAKEREWDQFHTPKNLAMALTVETSELMELFQWLTPEESYKVMKDPKVAQKIRDEAADTIIYLSRMADILDIDLNQAVEDKLVQNAKKYPVSLAKGNSTKYDEL